MTASKSRVPRLLMILAGLGALVVVDNYWWNEKDETSAVVVAPVQPRANLPVPAAGTQLAGPGRAKDDANAPVDDDKPQANTLNPLAAVKRDALSETVARPLFTVSRRAYKPPPPAAPRPVVARPPPAVTKPTYVLMGVMIGKNARIALLRPQGGTSDVSVKLGDTLGQWKVTSVEPDNVTLAQGEHDFTLQVFPK